MSNVMICVQLKDTVSLEWNQDLALKLKAIRQSKSITRKDLAIITTISYPLLEKIEMGTIKKITKDKLFLIATALNINVSELYPVIEIKLN